MSSPTPAETSAGAAVGLHRRIPMRISRPPAIRKKPQSPQSCIPQAMHRGPCLADPHAPRIPIRATSPYRHSLTMRPPRPARRLAQIFTPTSPANQLRRRAARRRRQRMTPPRDAASAQWEPAFRPARRPAAQARGSPGSRGRLDPAKVRRRGAGSRRTDGRSRRPGPASRRPPARPGVTHAPRRWGTVSLPF